MVQTKVQNVPVLSSLTDHELLMLCAQYGTQAKLWKQKFLGLLPEVERRQLYTKERCSSIFEFATKLGGVSREQTLLVLRLDKKFESAPEVHQLLVKGKVSVAKLARIASVTTSENQQFWATQSQRLSQPALETLVRDTKSVRSHASSRNKTEKISQSNELKLSTNMRQRLLALQNKGIHLEELLEDFLNQREEGIQRQKQLVIEEIKRGVKSSRYIPAKIKHLLKQEHGEKCAYEQCANKAVLIHHSRRFGLSPDHNPLFLAPLCKQHHEIAHSIDVRVQGYRKIF